MNEVRRNYNISLFLTPSLPHPYIFKSEKCTERPSNGTFTGYVTSLCYKPIFLQMLPEKAARFYSSHLLPRIWRSYTHSSEGGKSKSSFQLMFWSTCATNRVMACLHSPASLTGSIPYYSAHFLASLTLDFGPFMYSSGVGGQTSVIS